MTDPLCRAAILLLPVWREERMTHTAFAFQGIGALKRSTAFTDGGNWSLD